MDARGQLIVCCIICVVAAVISVTREKNTSAVDALDTKVTALQKEIENRTTALETRLPTMSSETRNIDAMLNKAENDISRLHKRVAVLEQKVDGLVLVLENNLETGTAVDALKQLNK